MSSIEGTSLPLLPGGPTAADYLFVERFAPGTATLYRWPLAAVGTGSGGSTGTGYTSVAVSSAGHLIFTLAGGGTVDAGSVVGPAGPAGAPGASGTGSGTVNTGTVNQLAYFASGGTVVSGLTLGTGLSISGSTLNASGGGSSYTLPAATGGALGGIKSSASIAVAGDGTATLAQNGASSGQVLQWSGSAWSPSTVSGGSSYTLTPAAPTALGGVKVGSGLLGASDGTMTLDAQPATALTDGSSLAAATQLAALTVINSGGTDYKLTVSAMLASCAALAGATFTGAVGVAPYNLTDAPTITLDASKANLFLVTLSGNRTLANPTNLTAGFGYTIQVTQDATGGRTLAFGSLFTWKGGTPPTLSTSPGAVDSIACYYDGAKLRCAAGLGFA